MAGEDFVVRIGADSTPLFVEVKKARDYADKELSKILANINSKGFTKSLETGFSEATRAFYAEIQKTAGQIKFDTIGTSLYKTLSSSIDEAFAPRPNALTQSFAKGQVTTDVALGDKEQQRAIVESMRKRYALEDELRKGAIEGERNLAQQKIDVNRSEQAAIVASMRARYAEEDKLRMVSAESQKQLQELINSYPRLRYALYDVSNMANNLSQSLIGVSTASVQMFAQYESAFTSVERTSGAQGTALNSLRSDLLNLATEIPLSFGQITEIATLGAQLGVASKDLAGFAENVAKFSATTNVSTTSAAQSFGALGELLNISAEDYNKLGSAIAYAGVNAVATETEILSVSTAIAGVSANAGLSAEYVLGLSTSLASLRVPAEQSRGALTRVFQEIARAAQSGGPVMAEFAAVLGTTTEEATKLAGTDMQSFFTQLLQGLSGMDSSQLTSTLDALNLSDIRVTNTLARLSDNMDVVNKSMADVNSSYASGTYLTDAYGTVADDLASKFVVLTSVFNEFVANAGSGLSVVLKPVIDFLIQFGKSLNDLSKSDIGKWVVGFTAGLLGFIGILSGVVAAVAMGYAGLLALRTAFDSVSQRGMIANGVLHEILAGLLRMPGATLSASAAFKGLAASVFTASNAMRALGGIGWMAAITAGIWAITEAWNVVANATKSAEDRAKDYYGSSTTIIDAAKVDAQEFAAGIQDIANSWGEVTIPGIVLTDQQESANALKAAADAAAESTGVIEDLANTQATLSDSTSQSTKAMWDQTYALGENAKAAALKIIQDKILADTENPLTKLFSDPAQVTALESAKVNIQAYTDAIIAGNQQQIAAIEAQMAARLEQLAIEQQAAFASGDTARADALTAEINALYNANENLAVYRDTTIGIVDAQAAQVAATASVTGGLDEQAGSLSAVVAAGEEAAQTTNALTEEMNKYVEQLFSGANAAWDTQDALSTLGEVLVNQGDAAAYAGGSLQAAISAMIAEDPSTAAGRLQYLLDYIIANVPSATGTIQYLQQAIAGLSDGTVKPIPFDVSAFTGGMKKAGSAAGGAAAKIRTLRDYASDLAKVFDRAFEIRFSGAESADKITESWRNIQKATADARIEIEDINLSINELNADIQSLTADKTLQEYFLSVANAYGDTLKASEIRAEIVKIDAELAKKTSDLTKKNSSLQAAQDKTNKTLVGNSDAAIENRNEIRGLIGEYQKQIQSLAASGLSQEQLSVKTEELRQDFINQATQLGYNISELGLYTAAFDDVKVAIDNVPRNITVAANVNPALQALNEFVAQARNAGGSAGGAWSSAFGEQAAKAARATAIMNQITALQAQAENARKNGANSYQILGYGYQMLALQNKLQSGNYADGGYTGAGGKYDVAGIVHRGEYVIPKEQVNQATRVPYFMEQPRTFAQGGYAGGGASTMMVSLSPEDRAILRSAGGSGEIVLYANNEAIARSANMGNKQIVAAGGRP